MSNDGFESVGKATRTWEPKQTGSTKTQDLKALEASDKSFIIGYYMGSESGIGKDGNSTAHKLEMTKVGDESMLIGEGDSDEISLWGTGVLNNKITEALERGQMVQGSLIKITWEGKKTSKTGRQYHAWDLAVNSKAEPKKVGNHFTADEQESIQKVEAAATADAGDDDDLPF